jgi:hypothetical protein
MEKLRRELFLPALVLASSFAFTCDARSQGQDPLQSITASAATVQDYPNGQVQFIATSHLQ